VLLPHVQERTKLVTEIVPMIDYLLHDVTERDVPAMLKKGMDKPLAKEVLQAFREHLSTQPAVDHAAAENFAREFAEKRQIKVGPVCMVLRIAVTGKGVTPPLFESMEVLGKEAVIKRLDETMALI
jgi:glutamyl-tRNA synthetase